MSMFSRVIKTVLPALLLVGAAFGQGTGQFGSGVLGGTGSVTGVLGTSNQIVSDGNAITPTLSLSPTLVLPGTLTVPQAGAASTPGLTISGAPFAGTGTTSFPQLYINCNGASGPTNFGTNGTQFGINTCTGFAGSMIDVRVNGGATPLFLVSATGNITTNSGVTAAGTVQAVSHVTGNTSTQFASAETYTVTACETAFAATTLATGATTTDTGLNCLPANSIIDSVVARVTTTITAACTGWSLGDATTAARFASNNTTLTSGTTTDAAHIGTFNNTGIASATTGIWQAAAAKVRITCAGGNPGAGAVRVVVYSHTSTAPTS